MHFITAALDGVLAKILAKPFSQVLHVHWGRPSDAQLHFLPVEPAAASKVRSDNGKPVNTLKAFV